MSLGIVSQCVILEDRRHNKAVAKANLAQMPTSDYAAVSLGLKVAGVHQTSSTSDNDGWSTGSSDGGGGSVGGSTDSAERNETAGVTAVAASQVVRPSAKRSRGRTPGPAVAGDDQVVPAQQMQLYRGIDSSIGGPRPGELLALMDSISSAPISILNMIPAFPHIGYLSQMSAVEAAFASMNITPAIANGGMNGSSSSSSTGGLISWPKTSAGSRVPSAVMSSGAPTSICTRSAAAPMHLPAGISPNVEAQLQAAMSASPTPMIRILYNEPDVTSMSAGRFLRAHSLHMNRAFVATMGSIKSMVAPGEGEMIHISNPTSMLSHVHPSDRQMYVREIAKAVMLHQPNSTSSRFRTPMHRAGKDGWTWVREEREASYYPSGCVRSITVLLTEADDEPCEPFNFNLEAFQRLCESPVLSAQCEKRGMCPSDASSAAPHPNSNPRIGAWHSPPAAAAAAAADGACLNVPMTAPPASSPAEGLNGSPMCPKFEMMQKKIGISLGANAEIGGISLSVAEQAAKMGLEEHPGLWVAAAMGDLMNSDGAAAKEKDGSASSPALSSSSASSAAPSRAKQHSSSSSSSASASGSWASSSALDIQGAGSETSRSGSKSPDLDHPSSASESTLTDHENHRLPMSGRGHSGGGGIVGMLVAGKPSSSNAAHAAAAASAAPPASMPAQPRVIRGPKRGGKNATAGTGLDMPFDIMGTDDDAGIQFEFGPRSVAGEYDLGFRIKAELLPGLDDDVAMDGGAGVSVGHQHHQRQHHQQQFHQPYAGPGVSVPHYHHKGTASALTSASTSVAETDSHRTESSTNSVSNGSSPISNGSRSSSNDRIGEHDHDGGRVRSHDGTAPRVDLLNLGDLGFQFEGYEGQGAPAATSSTVPIPLPLGLHFSVGNGGNAPPAGSGSIGALPRQQSLSMFGLPSPPSVAMGPAAHAHHLQSVSSFSSSGVPSSLTSSSAYGSLPPPQSMDSLMRGISNSSLFAVR